MVKNNDEIDDSTNDVKTFGIVGIVLSVIGFALFCYFVIWLIKRLTKNKNRSAFSYKY